MKGVNPAKEKNEAQEKPFRMEDEVLVNPVAHTYGNDR